jgi:hypothetical protein
MKRAPKEMSPGRKAHHTAKWARTMTKWLVTYTRRKGAKWNLVDFGGKTKSEARGIVDLIAIRKDHRQDGPGLKRGDLFEIVLIQTKGGSAPRPTPDDLSRLRRVGRHHKARAIVLAEWQRGEHLELFKLNGSRWHSVSPDEVFG